jgi:uncharacterized metal-binding protein (TIGR02443 family)
MRRFIAGAVCPECRAIDRTVVEVAEGRRQRRCVACGHCEQQIDASPPEPATRFVTRANASTPAQPVRLVEAVVPHRDKIAGPDSD